CGDLPLAVRSVQGVVDELRRDSEPRRGFPVLCYARLQSAILLIAVKVGDDQDAPQPRKDARRIHDEILKVVAAQCELVLRCAGSTANPDVFAPPADIR